MGALSQRPICSAGSAPLFASSAQPVDATASAPVGEKVAEYSQAGCTYELRLGTLADQQVAGLLQRVQGLAVLLIDGASFIDPDDTEWQVLYSYQVYKGEHMLMGFATLYPFNFLCGSELKTRLRLSQFVIFPPYQRQKHGNQMLAAVFKQAESLNAVEVTVEDPAAGFQAMRDRFDITRLQQLRQSEGPLECHQTVHRKLRVPVLQAQRIIEIIKFHKATAALGEVSSNTSDGAANAISQEGKMKEFRLSVKRRLHSEHFGKGAKVQPEEKKRQLQIMYESCVAQYSKIRVPA